MIQDQSIEEVKQRCNIVDIIGRYVALQRAGRNFKAVCPFHEEKTPSFVVSPDKQMFKCFGCGASGNVFSFLMKYDGLTFVETVEMLAKENGVPLIQDKVADNQDKIYREKLLNTLSLCARYFHAFLKEAQTALSARQYLAQRNIQPTSMDDFSIGYCHDDVDLFLKSLAKKDITLENLIESGVVLSGYGRPKLRFYNRVIFPIQDGQGRVIAFGGRSLSDEQMPKYLNSSESILFNKSRIFYGLNFAKHDILSQNFVIIVEGYMDAIQLHQSGIKNVVAVLGTALTPQHVNQLKRFTQEAVICFDADKAGEQATIRAMEHFLAGDMLVRVLKMPKGEDPDTLIIKHGRDDFLNRVQTAPHMLDFKLELLMNNHDIHYEMGKRKIVEDMMDSIQRISHPVSKQHHLENLSKKTGMDIMLLEKVKKSEKKDIPQLSAPKIEEKSRLYQSAEKLLELMAKDVQIREWSKSILQPKDFLDNRLRILAEHYWFGSKVDLTDHEVCNLQAQIELGDLPLGSVQKMAKDYVFYIKKTILDETYKDLKIALEKQDPLAAGQIEDIHRQQIANRKMLDELQKQFKN